jgi:hypothetical protein
MDRNKCIFTKFKTALILGLMITPCIAQYKIIRYTINNGGNTLQGGSYKIHASIGQIDASSEMSNGTYKLNGGFWHQKEAILKPDLMFSDGFEN